ncbi:WD40-repeat protein [Tribonema minus]|uniref:Serine-threonine kinase receptor-associated protein n=1 Tax=Tribonema minus TaxID=303371 RepID=A0A835YS18_9STRA|nr:WD40-repeat protein [Tribonema minus]
MASPESVISRQIPIVCPGHSRPLTEVVFSPETPDGVFLMSGCHAKTPMLRRGDTGDWIGTFEGHKGAVWGVALDPQAMIAATASADFSARLWDAISGKLTHEWPHKHIVKGVDFSQDSTTLATGGHEGIVRLFQVAQPDEEPRQFSVSSERTTINKVRWGLEPHQLLSGSSDGAVRMWDARTLELLKEVRVEGAVMDMEVSKPMSIITVAAGDKVTFLDARTLEVIKQHQMPINFKNEGGASLHPSGKRFIAGGSDLWVRVFDFETGAELECLKGHHGPVRCLRYTPGGLSYATGSEDGTIRIWVDENGRSQG